MKTMWFKISILGLLFAGVTASAAIKAKPGVYKVKAYLSIQNGKTAKLFINPMSRDRYTINIQNPSKVAKSIDTPNYFGPVDATFKLYNPGPGSGPGEIQQIKIIKQQRIPAYSGAFKAK